MSATQAPGRFGLTMVAVMIPLAVVISLLLMFMTDWPTWVTSVIGGGSSGLVSPFIVRWILKRRERVPGRPSPSSER